MPMSHRRRSRMQRVIRFAIVSALAVGVTAGTATVELRAGTAASNALFARAGGAVGHAPINPSAPASAFGMDVPLAYYSLAFTLSKRTGGITPPVQSRIFAYMGLALYESVV